MCFSIILCRAGRRNSLLNAYRAFLYTEKWEKQLNYRHIGLTFDFAECMIE